MKEFRPLAHKVAHFGLLNTLSQTLVKITCPGVPDFYQGTELWDLNLVDPDNRRPVDFEKRKAMLKDIHARVGDDTLKLIEELLSAKDDGEMKLFLIYKVLKARTRSPELFQQGRYIPLDTTGRLRGHIIAFARSHDKERSLTIAPRFLTGLIKEGEYPLGAETWQDTRVMLPPRVPDTWTDAITERVARVEGGLSIGNALRFFPVSLLIGRENP